MTKEDIDSPKDVTDESCPSTEDPKEGSTTDPLSPQDPAEQKADEPTETTPETAPVEEGKKDADNTAATDTSRKRAADLDDDVDPKKPKLPPDSDFVLKMLCPFWCVGAVIGTKGEEIKRMKEQTGCSIKVSKNFNNFPTTNERVVSFKGKADQISKLVLEVQSKIREDKPPVNAPLRDNSKRKSELKLVVATSSAGRVIGKAGCRTKQFQEDYKVHIDVMKADDLPPGLKESVVNISGDNDSVDACTREVIGVVAEDTKANLNYSIDYSEYSRRDNPQPNNRDNWGAPYGMWGSRFPPPPPPPPHWGGYRGGYPGYFGNRGGYGGRW